MIRLLALVPALLVGLGPALARPITEAEASALAAKIDLTNPWGSSHVTGLSAKDFLRFYRGIRVGA